MWWHPVQEAFGTGHPPGTPAAQDPDGEVGTSNGTRYPPPAPGTGHPRYRTPTKKSWHLVQDTHQKKLVAVAQETVARGIRLSILHGSRRHPLKKGGTRHPPKKRVAMEQETVAQGTRLSIFHGRHKTPIKGAELKAVQEGGTRHPLKNAGGGGTRDGCARHPSFNLSWGRQKHGCLMMPPMFHLNCCHPLA